jgi:hypothetical protein
MDPLLGALQRVVEIDVHKEIGSIYGKVEASNKEMANLMRGANNWNDQSLRDVKRRLGVKYPCNGFSKLQDAILVHLPFGSCCNLVASVRGSQICGGNECLTAKAANHGWERFL